MSEKKKKNVQLAEESKPSEGNSKVVQTEQPKEAVVTPSAIDISSIDPKKIKLAEDMGVPVGQIIAWVNRTEERMVMHEQVMEQIVKKMPSAEAIVAKIQEIGQARQAEYQKRSQQQGAQPKQGKGTSLTDILQLAGVGGQQQANPYQEQMMKAMFQKTMTGMDLSNALTKAMILKLAPELADEITKTMLPKKEE